MLGIAVVLLLLAGIIAWDASQLGAGATYASVGPKDFPYMIAGGLALLAIWTAFEGYAGAFPAREPDRVMPMVWVVGGLVAQIVLLGPLGFSIATGVMFGLVARGFGDRRIWITIPVGIVVCLALYLLFHFALELSLPAGPLETAVERTISSLTSQSAG